MRALTTLALGTAMAGLTTGAALAQGWTEVGDAGEFPADCAQDAGGTGPLLTIAGSTSTGSDDFVDSFVISIADPAVFYATTSSAMDPAAVAVWDTRLFLFNLDGRGVLANDDAPGVAGTQSYVSDPGIFGGVVDPSAAPLTAGLYVLVISGYSNDPLGVGGTPMFDIGSDFDALFGPAAGAGPFDQWENFHGLVQSGPYTIALQGAELVGDHPPCPADINCDRVVDVDDLIEVILAWGTSGGRADIDGNGTVDVDDLTVVILGWGECP